MNSKYKVYPFILLSTYRGHNTVRHGMVKNPMKKVSLFTRPNDQEGELLFYEFTNLVPHKFNGHFNNLRYDEQMKVLELYKKFN